MQVAALVFSQSVTATVSEWTGRMLRKRYCEHKAFDELTARKRVDRFLSQLDYELEISMKG